MVIHRVAGSLVPFAIALALGCEKPNATPAPVSSQSAPVVAPSAMRSTAAPSASAPSQRRQAEWGPRHRGVLGMLLWGTRDLDLKEPQKAEIAKLQEQMRPDEEPGRAQFKEYHAALVAQVKEGKIEPAKLAPLKANMEKELQARKDKDAEQLNALHAALEPEQRKKLAENVRAKQAERQAAIKARMGDAGMPSEADWKKRRVERLTEQLGLDAAQQKSVEALFSKGQHPAPAAMETMREEVAKRNDALLTAFESDTFDAKKLELWPVPSKKLGEQTDKHIATLSQLVAILKPEQREKLATIMERPMMGRRAGYPVDDETGFGYFYNEPHHGEAMPPRL